MATIGSLVGTGLPDAGSTVTPTMVPAVEDALEHLHHGTVAIDGEQARRRRHAIRDVPEGIALVIRERVEAVEHHRREADRRARHERCGRITDCP